MTVISPLFIMSEQYEIFVKLLKDYWLLGRWWVGSVQCDAMEGCTKISDTEYWKNDIRFEMIWSVFFFFFFPLLLFQVKGFLVVYPISACCKFRLHYCLICDQSMRSYYIAYGFFLPDPVLPLKNFLSWVYIWS